MITSESISKIAPALIKAQAAITFAAKDSTNPHFRSKFAGLPAVIDAVKPALNDANIAFIQTASPSDDGKLHLTTRLIHESGEWIQDCAVCPLPKADPQGFGSAMTYLRRYSLASVIGLYQDDDDGEAASRHQQSSKPDPVADAPKAEPLASDDQLSELAHYELNEHTAETVKKALAYYKVKEARSLTQKQAALVIKKSKAALEKHATEANS